MWNFIACYFDNENLDLQGDIIGIREMSNRKYTVMTYEVYFYSYKRGHVQEHTFRVNAVRFTTGRNSADNLYHFQVDSMHIFSFNLAIS